MHDGARDLLHDARAAAAALGDASADYAPPVDLADRALAALDARALDARAPDARATNTGVPEAQVTAAHAPDQSASPGPAARPGVRRWIPLAAAAAALGAFAWAGTQGPAAEAPERPAAGAWSGQVAQVARAVEGGPLVEGLTGLAVTEGAQRFDVRAGTELTPGMTLATDERTRAVFALADGSRFSLNRSTEVAFTRETRAVNLTRGELLADVAHDAALPNAQLHTPHGTVEVLGTKFVLTASDTQTSVRVTRGVVRLQDDAGETLEVRAGEEGLAGAGGLRVVPATDLAGSIRWASLPAEEDAPELLLDDAPVPGLGELRAHVPGERQEQDRALRLAEHRVRVRIAGNVARTEIEETFESDDDAVLEGVYRFPLPPDARIASLALEVDGAWEEGAFLSKETAKRIWRGVIRNATPETQRRNQEEWIWVPGPWRDPALLEWQRGGRFELRIFPIPARGARRVRIAYEQTLPRVETAGGSSRRYVYPLAHAQDGSAEVGRFDLDVRVAGAGATVTSQGYALERQTSGDATQLRFRRERFRPAGDLVLAVERPGSDAPLRSWAYRGPAVAPPPASSRESEEVRAQQAELAADGRGYVVFALRPELPRLGADVRRDYVLLVDSSQSMVGERMARAQRLARTMAGEMDRRDRVMAIACDLDCRASALAPASPDAAADVFAHLGAREPAGSSNVAFALRRSLELARAAGAGGDGRALQLVYLGDGAASAGPRTPALLTAATAPLFAPGGLGEGARLTAVGIGQDADAPALAALARAGGGQHVAYVPGRPAEEAALAALEATFGPQLEHVRVSLPPGITDVAPAALPNLRSGQELLVSGRLAGDLASGDVVLEGTVDGAPFSARWPVRVVASSSAGNAFVPRLWASQRLASLEAAGKGADVPRMVALSKGYGVLSRETSLLVLESEAMFRAFGVDRARPTVQWTGEEEVVEGNVAAVGSGALDLAGRGRGAGGAAPPRAPVAAGSAARSAAARLARPAFGDAEDAAPLAEETDEARMPALDDLASAAQPTAATGMERRQAEALALPRRESVAAPARRGRPGAPHRGRGVAPGGGRPDPPSAPRAVRPPPP
ncbi:MAG: FecR domain-containing protein, partial [Myxococcota bacterium]